MLKKGTPPKFARTGSAMHIVYQQIEAGVSSRAQIQIKTRMSYKKVSAALWSLTFTGVITKHKAQGGYRYTVTGKQQKADTSQFANINSIFNVVLDDE